MGGEHRRIGRHTIAFSHDEVAADDVDAGDAFLNSVANYERTRTGEIALAFEHALGAGFLNDGHQNRGAGKNACIAATGGYIQDGRARGRR